MCHFPTACSRAVCSRRDIDGNTLVADRQSGQVYLFDWYGTTIGASPYTSCSGNPDARPFQHPYRVAVWPGASVTPGAGGTGKAVLVVDTDNDRVVICDASMNFIAEFGTPI